MLEGRFAFAFGDHRWDSSVTERCVTFASRYGYNFSTLFPEFGRDVLEFNGSPPIETRCTGAGALGLIVQVLASEVASASFKLGYVFAVFGFEVFEGRLLSVVFPSGVISEEDMLPLVTEGAVDGSKFSSRPVSGWVVDGPCDWREGSFDDAEDVASVVANPVIADGSFGLGGFFTRMECAGPVAFFANCIANAV